MYIYIYTNYNICLLMIFVVDDFKIYNFRYLISQNNIINLLC